MYVEAISVMFIRLPKVSNDQIGENLPNLVTMYASNNSNRRNFLRHIFLRHIFASHLFEYPVGVSMYARIITFSQRVKK
jgi:hypothetical protein